MPVRLRFRHIEAFQAVMHSGTATGAAALLHVTQPAISQIMTEMEGIVGFALFDRRGGRLVPTRKAELLFEEIDRSFVGLDHLNDFCQRTRSDDTHAIIIATVPSFALTVLPNAIERYRRTIARDFFSIHARLTDLAIGWVGSQKADLGFGTKGDALPGIHCEEISRFPAVCALPANHDLARKAAVEAGDLDGEPFIVMSRTEGVHDAVQRVLAERGAAPRDVAECPMATAACAMVAAGVGITLVDQGAAAHFLDRGVVLRPFVPAVPVSFYAYWLTSRKPHFKRSLFIDLLRERSREIEGLLEVRLRDGLAPAAAGEYPMQGMADKRGGRRTARIDPAARVARTCRSTR